MMCLLNVPGAVVAHMAAIEGLVLLPDPMRHYCQMITLETCCAPARAGKMSLLSARGNITNWECGKKSKNEI